MALFCHLLYGVSFVRIAEQRNKPVNQGNDAHACKKEDDSHQQAFPRLHTGGENGARLGKNFDKSHIDHDPGGKSQGIG